MEIFILWAVSVGVFWSSVLVVLVGGGCGFSCRLTDDATELNSHHFYTLLGPGFATFTTDEVSQVC